MTEIKNNKRPKKEELMMCLAVMISRMSTCRRLHVGSVITDDRYEQVAIGYNGSYRGGPNECLRATVGTCGCIHSEINALIKLKFRPYSMYVTDSPCESCASAIVNADVKRVFFARPYRLTDGIEILEKSHVHCVHMHPGEFNVSMLLGFGVDLRKAPFSWKIFLEDEPCI